MAQLSLPATPSLEALNTPAKLTPNRVALWAGVLIFSTLSLWAAATSEGFLEADACTHYLFARFALSEPHYLTSVWGRPLCTGLHAIPAAIGKVMGVRVMSLILALGCGLIAYRIAKKQGYRMPALAAILLFAQPLFFLHSFSELTEIPFAFVSIAAFWAYQEKKWLAMTILVSLTVMGRPEGLGLMLLAALALLLHRRWYYLFLMPLPLLLWSYLGWLTWDSPADLPWYLWLKKNWPYAARSAYGSGPWFQFIIQLPVLVSPVIFPALLLGIGWSLRAGLKRFAFFSDHEVRVQVMIAAIPLMILAVHSLLWSRGLMASNGMLRYLLSVAPLWALLCAKGWEWCWERFALPLPFLCAGIAAAIPILVNVYWKMVPLPLYDEDSLARSVAQWYQRTADLARDYPKVMSTLPMVYYTMDLSQSDKKRAETWSRHTVEKQPPGTILIWDPVYGEHNADRGLCMTREEIEGAGWIWIGNLVEGGAWCNVYLSPTTIDAKETETGKYRTPGSGW